MGLSTSKSKTTSNQTSNQTGSTTPTNPEWVTNDLMDYTGRIGSMLDTDPSSFVAGASPLQQQAWSNADRLGGWQGNNNAASQIALGVANQGANLMPGSAGYTASRGNASTYSAPQLNNAREATTSDAGSASLLDNFQSYFNPFMQNVVGSSMADFDQQAGQQRAQLAARGAQAHALGGSRFGIAEGQMEGELARGRNSILSSLLSQGFNTAAGLSQSDAANRQQSGLFNAAARNTASLANQGASNQFSLAQAGMDNDAARYGADASNQFNQNYLQRADAAAQFGAQGQNDMERFNAGQMDQGLNRQLQSSQLLGSLGNDHAQNTLQDLAMMSQMGGEQRNIEQAYNLAPLAQLQAGGQLFGATPFQIFSGQNVTSIGTQSGTNTTTQSPSLFNSLMAGAQAAAMFL